IHNTATDETHRHINAIAAVNVEMHAKVLYHISHNYLVTRSLRICCSNILLSQSSQWWAAEDDPNEGLTGEMVHNTPVPQRFLIEICVPANKLIDGPYAILYTSMIQQSHSVSLSLGRVDPYTLLKSSSVTAASSNEIRGWRRCHRFDTTIPCRSVA
ncbi:hypothetical protein Tsp_12844, partial [Trichinella spiralis]